MIIRETNDTFIMINQHDHAYLSGEITKHFNPALLKSDQFFEDMVLASYQHDRSWIGLDATPIWNDASNIPYSFSDYPLLPKLAFYKIGLDEIQQMNAYSCLLCSLHYCSFFSQTTDPDCLEFLKEEKDRQLKIKKELTDLDDELLFLHFHLLQFSDNLSLYICLNEPGVDKVEEHPWFKNGFRNTENFHPHKQKLTAKWLNETEISMNAFPFQDDLPLHLKFKNVPKRAVQEAGIATAYEKAGWEEKVFIIKRE